MPETWNNEKRKRNKYLITALIAVLLAGLSVFAAMKGVFGTLESMAEDTLYQREGRIPDDIRIIKIDEKTLSRLGPYNEWDRSYFAQLLGILNESEETAPRVIGLDVVFSESNGGEADRELVRQAGKFHNVVAASRLLLDRYTEEENGSYSKVAYISGEERPFPALDEVVEVGFTNALFDEDGIIRNSYTHLVSYYFDEVSEYDGFAYKLAVMAGMAPQVPAKIGIAFTGKPGEFESISMVDVLDGAVPKGYFRDSIVLVGAYAEGMLDAYRVPIDYSTEMYGVEIQANILAALQSGRMLYVLNPVLQGVFIFVLVALYTFYACNTRLRNNVLALVAAILVYFGTAAAVFSCSDRMMKLLAAPAGLLLAFFLSFLYRHFEMQRERMDEMQSMLFSMAEAMAEAIEGRTPYNANHTKNVAKRCVELLDFINEKHRKKETDLYFSQGDRQQLYLAAMLHDVGKMDVPLEVMDKPTKLGSREQELSQRLQMICLRLELDARDGHLSRQEADCQIAKIQAFLESLGDFNCGRPLKEEEWQLINEIAEGRYVSPGGQVIPYLLQEEIEDLHIPFGTLSEGERKVMQGHVVYTDKILSHMQFGEQFGKVRAMASNHHELLNGKGYPKGIGADQLDTMTRILTIMDIYDSLIADDRPYKKPKPVRVAFEILEEEAAAGMVDHVLLKYAEELYGKEE